MKLDGTPLSLTHAQIEFRPISFSSICRYIALKRIRHCP